LAIWLPTIKSQDSPWFPCMQVTCHTPLKNSWWRLQLYFKFHLHRRSAEEVMGLQSCESPNFKYFGTLTWESPDKMPFGCRSYGQAQRILIKGKVVTSPKSRLWWILWVCVCSWLVRAPKVLQLCINQLVVWFVQVRVSNWLSCHFS
jgi:hypothetical protein